MALNETIQYENEIYQIETDDPVLGGPEGVANLPHSQLANRTAYLKEAVDGVADEVADARDGEDSLTLRLQGIDGDVLQALNTILEDHNPDGSHKAQVVGESNLDIGVESGKVSAKSFPIEDTEDRYQASTVNEALLEIAIRLITVVRSYPVSYSEHPDSPVKHVSWASIGLPSGAYSTAWVQTLAGFAMKSLLSVALDVTESGVDIVCYHLGGSGSQVNTPGSPLIKIGDRTVGTFTIGGRETVSLTLFVKKEAP